MLPEEVVDEIIRYNFFRGDESFKIDYQSLINYSLVARTWRPPAQSLLFHHVILHKMDGFLNISLSLDGNNISDHQKWLACRVRILELTIDEIKVKNEKDEDKSGTYIPFIKIPDVLLLFPNLYELHLSLGSVLLSPKERANVFERLKSPLIPQISALTLQTLLRRNCPAQLLHQLLRTPLPIKFLTLGTFPQSAIGDPPTYTLVEFKSDSIPREALPWMLTASIRAESLKVLHVPGHCLPEIPKFRRLEKLYITDRVYDYWEPLVPVPRKLTELGVSLENYDDVSNK